MGVKDRPQCYFDVELNREPVGRIVFQLFSDVCPKTSKNFLCLCTGEKGTGKITGKKLCYKGSTFHRVVKNFMVQGGDFTEGNGRGGESIYGGYFEDENFILKHDRAFLLSMANRGKDTNGSQFFITTKTAPHLDGVHVVFGVIISGFEVIKKVEGLKTDSASRPYADVRVMDCGQLFTKSANDVLEGKRKRASRSADSSLHTHDSSSPPSSSVGSESESDERYKLRKPKRHAKSKRSKRKRMESKKDIDVWPANQSSPSPVERETLEEDGEVEQEPSGRREKPVVRPEEIPPVPENRFLLRRGMPSQEEKTEIVEKEEQSVSTDPKPAVSKSGRKIKGRGTMRYHTPTRSKSRSASVEERRSSETPPHWKEEMKRTKVYQPPSSERWSKGDKWEDRSDSAWSRSAQHSSDRSSQRSSLRRQQMKEKKKAKRKKKAKKRKHDKKKSCESKPEEPILPVGRRSVSSEMKSRRSRSLTRSSSNPNNSPAWRRQSPLSFRDSRSYSRSYTPGRSRSKGRSRSYSRSRSLSRSRGRSLSRSRSRSYSRSQSRSRSRSQYRSRSLSPPRKKSLSRSPRKRNVSKHKADSGMSGKLPESKVPAAPRPPSVPAPESAPVIPMSDSPPPSRWKPDQKPWRPSYIHTQEIKAKVAPSSPTGQTAAGLTERAQTPKCLPGDSERHKAAGRSLSRSSRSRSYSRSYSRSRSRSYSRSRSRSPRKYKSRSSSYSRSNSENSQNTSSHKKSTLGKEWKAYYSSLSRIKNVDKYISTHSIQDALPGSEKTASCEPGPDASDSRRGGSSEKMRGSGSSQGEETKHCGAVLVERFNSKSEWDSDSDKVSRSNSATLTRKQKQAGRSDKTVDKKLSALTGWNSESDCENITAKTLAISEKEEGEASSESECETSRKSSEALMAQAPVAASSRPEESTEKAPQPEKHKSKKKSKRKCRHKRRSVNKSCSHHRKDKGKRSKRKQQRLKETFHWQPPLEFGEEEEEDESKREKPGGALKERPAVGSMDERCSSLNKIRNAEKDKTEKCIKKRPKHAELHLQSSKRNGENLPSVKEQESLDDMDICTPEHDAEIVEHLAAQDMCDRALTLRATSRPSDVPSRGGALREEPPPVASATSTAGLRDEAPAGRPAAAALGFKWRPLKGTSALRDADAPPLAAQRVQLQETPDAQSVRMEIKSTSRVRPGSLFDEVRKTARLNQRPRNQESSSEERSASGGSTRSPKKSRSASSRRSRSRGWSRSYSRSRSRSRSSSYTSRSRSPSRRRRGRGQSRSRSRTYRSYGSHSRASSSHSRSRSYGRRRRSRSDSYDSYSSRSASRRRRRRHSDSYRSSDRRSRSYRSSSSSSSGRSRSSRYS
ncbi:NK-tumor recognition protein isoform X3 [Gasterosteus aculeatus]